MVRNDVAVGNNSTNSKPRQQEIIENLINLAQIEKEKGNPSITTEKINRLTSYLQEQQQREQQEEREREQQEVQERVSYKSKKLPSVPKPIPKYSPLLKKFKVKSIETNKHNQPKKVELTYYQDLIENFSFKKLENIFITVLEMIGALLDNLHLFSKMPMFPPVLNKFLKNTNKLWIIILIFLIRKTITQLLNVRRKENKVNLELKIIKSQKSFNVDIDKKYNKVLKDLKYDKFMLILELFGNFLDLTFNTIEYYGIPLPEWFMSGLNFTSMIMAVYRMNKDDEYLDDDITEDLI